MIRTGCAVRTMPPCFIYFKITAEAVRTSLKYQISQGSNRVGDFYGHKWATTKTVFGKHTLEISIAMQVLSLKFDNSSTPQLKGS